MMQSLADGEYKVYKTSRWIFKYTVVDPLGIVLTVVCTLWGARLAIQRDKVRMSRPQPKKPFWNNPVVHREEK